MHLSKLGSPSRGGAAKGGFKKLRIPSHVVFWLCYVVLVKIFGIELTKEVHWKGQVRILLQRVPHRNFTGSYGCQKVLLEASC